jgi:catechol 2,3-dioxygenase-like lactoylglutathione lyase family enzyme
MTGPQGPVVPAQPAAHPIDPQVRIGHVHLRTADIARVRAFYVDLLGFDVVYEARGVPGWGTIGDVLFVSAGGCHHHLGFNTWKSRGGGPQPDGVAGLHHVALVFSSQAELARIIKRLLDAGVQPYQAPLSLTISGPSSRSSSITGVGGGMVRDFLLRLVPNVLRTDLYAVPALLGATVLVVAHDVGARSALFPLLAASVCIAVRLIGVHYGIELPIAPSEHHTEPPPN